MTNRLTALLWNFENNGGDNRPKRIRAHKRLASLNPHLVLRQEMPAADLSGKATMYDLETILGLRGWLGAKSCTALFAHPAYFQPVREFPPLASGPATPAPSWELPPTALAMRYTPAGPDATPLVLGSYHLDYSSSGQRLTEAQWLSRLADKRWTTPEGQTVRMPCLLGGDNNSYPVPGTPGDPPLPVLEQIQDRRHRLHRSYVGPDGKRRMDDRPDEALRTAGLEDVARYRAATYGERTAVTRTVSGCATHGPDARIDRYYATSDIAEVVISVDVIEVHEKESDHHIVRAVLDGDGLSDVLNLGQSRHMLPTTS
ncbi:endonuclease/exonuclease/phosphatase family protein [Streptomyces sp. NPDC057620]|uniref:endonuclease/exonuclease/phosphatase family protein n=1 Tax=Streptomyces sp. NPDC057620 TaxID=3346185 RepID=UPI0036ADC065